MIDKKIILASKSPRRSELLTKAGIPFVIKTADTEETYPDSLAVRSVPEFLAKKKALAVQALLDTDEIILAADCVVVYQDKIFGKPNDYADAVKILSVLSGSQHEVITGVCLLSKNKEVLFSDVSKVFMEPLSQKEIHYYIDNFQPYDKAGAYGIQEWIGYAKISKIEGTYSNIVGLPVNLVYEALQQF